MRFFDRENELERLADIERRSRQSAQFTVLTGRRRVGKTSLLLKAFSRSDFAYLFVERKSEKDLCQTFKAELEASTLDCSRINSLRSQRRPGIGNGPIRSSWPWAWRICKDDKD